MHALSLALFLAAGPAPAVAAPVPAVAPVPASTPAAAPAVRPTLLTDEPTPTPTSSATPAASPTPAKAPPAPLPQATVEKLGQGDRAFLAGDYRNALFAYQDAVYLAPKSASARVRLGRAYLALRYPAQATAQAEQALALDPESAEARQLVEDAKAAPSRPAGPPARTAGAAARTAPAEIAPVGSADAAPSRNGGIAVAATPSRNGGTSVAPTAGAATTAGAAAGPRVYPFAEAEPASARTAAAARSPGPGAVAVAPLAVAPAAMPGAQGGAAAAPSERAPAGEEAPATFGVQREFGDVRVGGTAMEAQLARVAAPQPGGPTAAQRYRAALDMLANREFEKAVAELTQAIVLDPRLAVAYAARGSARFGLGRYREAADDYRVSIELDENLGTPLYGLAECYRVLGDGKRAAEMYQRYADSRAPDVREDLRTISAKRSQELR